MIPLRCPLCRAPLAAHGGGLSCACGASFDVVDGVAVLAPCDDAAAPCSPCLLLSELQGGRSWRAVVWEAFGATRALLHHLVIDESRGDFRYVLPWLPNGRVLEVDPGWSTIATHLARDYREVVVMDRALDHARFITMRCRQDEVTNVQCLCADVLHSPLPDLFFDLIVTNGLLERIEALAGQEDPRPLQLSALRALRQALKPHGVLFLGVDKRRTVERASGELAQAAVADGRSSTAVRRGAIGAWTESDYQAFLVNVGFTAPRLYYPVPEAMTPHCFINAGETGQVSFYNNALAPPEHRKAVAQRERSRETAARREGPYVDHAARGFGIVAGTPSAPSLARAIADHAGHCWQRLLPGEAEPSRLHVLHMAGAAGKRFERGRIKFFIFKDGEATPVLVATMCRDAGYDASLHRELEACDLLARAQVRSFRWPEFATLSNVAGRSVLFRRAWPGTPFAKRLETRPAGDVDGVADVVRQDFGEAAKVLAELHHATQHAGSSTAGYINDVFTAISAHWPALFPGLDRVRKTVDAVYGQAADRLLHGDFTPWNIFRLDGTGRSSDLGLIDWELAATHGATIVDYGRFVYYYLAHLSTTQRVAREELLHQVFVTRDGWLSELVMHFLRGALSAGALEPGTIPHLMQFALLHDLVVQLEHSAHPALKLAQNFARAYNAVHAERVG